eukprot:scaffold243_cov175-Amphora_coffeaeformis.AAC.2
MFQMLRLMMGLLVLASTNTCHALSSSMEKIKLTYFNIEGVAEPMYVSIFGGIEYEDERIAFDQWKDMKPKMPFGQLPVLTINDGPMQTQSMAMLRWVGMMQQQQQQKQQSSSHSDKSSLLYPVNDPAAVYKIEEAMGVVEDLRKSWTPCLAMGRAPLTYGHPEGFFDTADGQARIQQVRELWVRETFPLYAQQLQGLLAKYNGQWLASTEAPTIVDCVAVVFLRGFTKGHVEHVPVDLLDAYPPLVDYVKRFCALLPGRYTDGLHE